MQSSRKRAPAARRVLQALYRSRARFSSKMQKFICKKFAPAPQTRPPAPTDKARSGAHILPTDKAYRVFLPIDKARGKAAFFVPIPQKTKRRARRSAGPSRMFKIDISRKNRAAPLTKGSARPLYGMTACRKIHRYPSKTYSGEWVCLPVGGAVFHFAKGAWRLSVPCRQVFLSGAAVQRTVRRRRSRRAAAVRTTPAAAAEGSADALHPPAGAGSCCCAATLTATGSEYRV